MDKHDLVVKQKHNKKTNMHNNIYCHRCLEESMPQEELGRAPTSCQNESANLHALSMQVEHDRQNGE